MKSVLIGILFLFAQQITFAQNADKTVSITVSGSGKTQEEAKHSALRSAIEQAFGAFISSKTEILNDNLVKDEVISVANGNIQKFEIISEVQIPNGGYATTLKATVSVTKLTSYIEKKGGDIEFKGNLFSYNISQKELMQKNELIVIENLVSLMDKLLWNCFDLEINSVGEPKSISNKLDEKNSFKIPISVNIKFNKNVTPYKENLFNTLKGISLSKNEALDLMKMGVSVYPVCIAISEDKFDYFILRNKESTVMLRDYFYKNLVSYNIPLCVTTNNGNCIQIEKHEYDNRSDQEPNKTILIDKKFKKALKHDPMGKSYYNELLKDHGHCLKIAEANLDYLELTIVNKYILFYKYNPNQPYVELLETFKYNHLSFTKKLSKKIIITKSPYNSMSRFDEYHIGDIIALSEMTDNKLFYTVHFYDYRNAKEIKNVSGYKVKLNK
jgi:hypothetical protein